MGTHFRYPWTLPLVLLLVGQLVICTAPEPQSEAEPNAESESEPEGEAEAKGEGEPEKTGGEPIATDGEPSSEAQSKAEMEPEGEAKGEAEGEAEGEPETEPEGEPEGAAVEGEPGASEEENVPEGESENANPVETCTFITLYSLCIVLILVGNILVAATIMKNKHLRNNTSNLYLVSLVSARASIGVLVVPARITGMFSEQYLGSILCKLCHFAAMGSATASVFSIVAIAIIKYRFIVSANNQGKDIPMRTAILIIVLIWVLGFLYAIRAPIMYDLNLVDTGVDFVWSCSVSPIYQPVNKYFILIDIVCLFAAPFSIIVTCYAKVISYLSNKVTTTDEGEAPPTPVKKQSLKAIQMLIILMSLFTVCTAAPLIMQAYIMWGDGYFPNRNVVSNSIYLFSYSNAWMNVVVFAIFRDDIRKAFMQFKCVQRCACSSKDTETQIFVKTTDSSIEKDKPSSDTVSQDSRQQEALRMMEF